MALPALLVPAPTGDEANMIVLCYSGGIDSTVLLYDLLAQGEQVLAVGFAYGQTHRRELVAAEAIYRELGMEPASRGLRLSPRHPQ